jgi:hypothetical protein
VEQNPCPWSKIRRRFIVDENYMQLLSAKLMSLQEKRDQQKTVRSRSFATQWFSEFPGDLFRCT